MHDAKSRLSYIIKDLGLKNPKKFSESLGFARPDRIYTVFRGQNDISARLAKIINEKYPQYPIAWLITGEGEMPEGEQGQDYKVSQNVPKVVQEPSFGYSKEKQLAKKTEEAGVSYYFPYINASAGLSLNMISEDEERIPVQIPYWKKKLYFINVFGDSMYPKFQSGQIIGIKQIKWEYLNFGYTFVVVMQSGEVYLKYVKKGKDDEHVVLESENKCYDPREFHIKRIRFFYLVEGLIAKLKM